MNFVAPDSVPPLAVLALLYVSANRFSFVKILVGSFGNVVANKIFDLSADADEVLIIASGEVRPGDQT